MAQGVFITFEGGEGAGKSTQVKALAQSLRQKGQTVLTTREPGGSPGAENIRGLLLEGEASRWDARSEALLHFIARRDHAQKVILPALRRGDWVLCDRFSDSTMAYQGYGHQLGRAAIEAIAETALGDLDRDLLTPRLTIILDLAVAVGLERAKSRGAGADRYESMDLAFHERLRQGFLQIAKDHPARCAVLSAEPAADQVAADILSLVEQRFSGEAS